MSVYLDHAATTPLRPTAFEAMVPWLTASFGNPSGGHAVAREARRAVDDARDEVALLLGCRPGEVIFTSGGTEADNLAMAAGGGRPVCSAVEHHAVLHPVEAASGRTVAVDSFGRADLDDLRRALDEPTSVVSVMLANNEVGTINDLAAVAAAVDGQALLHTDAVQAVAWLDVASLAASADLISLAAHKFGGPQGVGALIARAGTRVRPLILGGGQERERRSGTHNVAGIVGMAAALAAAVAERDDAVRRVAALRDRLVRSIRSSVGGVVETAVGAPRLPNIAHLRFEGIEAESLLVLLDDAGVCASGGSSCASGAMEPSHVLAAMGVARDDARSAVRFSLGRATTEAEIDAAASAVDTAVRRLRTPARVGG